MKAPCSLSAVQRDSLEPSFTYFKGIAAYLVLVFLGLGTLVDILLASMVCNTADAQERKAFSPSVRRAIDEAWTRAGRGYGYREWGFVLYTDGTIGEMTAGASEHLELHFDKKKTVLAVFHTHPHTGYQNVSPADEETSRRTSVCIYAITNAGIFGTRSCPTG
jgi:hypothetical protein